MAGASSCLNSVITEPSPDLRITHYSYVVPDCYCTELGVNVSGGALELGGRAVRLRRLCRAGGGAHSACCALRAGDVSDPRLAAPLFLPYLGDGERDDPALRAAFIGLSDRHGRDELAYAVLEGLAFAVTETVSVLTAAGSPLEELRVAGGGARVPALGRSRPTRSGIRSGTWRMTQRRSAWRCWRRRRPATPRPRRRAAAGLARARRFEPDDGRRRTRSAERYNWFLDVRPRRGQAAA